jgi:hypothetical protein
VAGVHDRGVPVTDWRKKFPRPNPEAVWCDECLRWETGTGGRFKSPRETVATRVLHLVASGVHWVGFRIHEVGDRLQIRDNIKKGVFDARV